MSQSGAKREVGWSRREFLVAAGATAAAALLPRTSRAAGGERVIVTLFLRGAADGLNLCVPQDDPDYYALRPRIQVPAGSALDLDGFFGLHPSLAPLLPLYRSGVLALVHAAGSPDPTRSHFDAQGYMERAVPGDKSILDGWLNRYLVAISSDRPIAGIRLGGEDDATLLGPAPSVGLQSIEGFRLGGFYRTQREGVLRTRYAANVGGVLGRGAGEAFAALDEIGAVSTETSARIPSRRSAA